tara:strand:- start:206 stop:949 length:744 start_codon:yes stop_codon:yes gene_type:complete
MIDIISPLIKQFLPFAQERMGFSEPPRLFLRGDDKNAQNPLGKTAYYDPDKQSITVYITGRHPKDVMRSISHELVHHAQCCRGDLDGQHRTDPGYTQNDEYMREMEREAYEKGNMCFRDWEDSLKNTIYLEHLQKGENKMSTKDWKNNEIKGLLAESWGFKMDLSKLNESAEEEQLEEVEELEEQEEEITEEDELDEAKKGKYDDGDGKDEKCDHIPCEDQDKRPTKEQIETLVKKAIKEALQKRKG